MQADSRKEWDIKKELKRSKAKHPIRDLIIYELSKIELNILKDYVKNNVKNEKGELLQLNIKNRDQLISNMIETFGYKASSDNIRKIISNQKKIQKNCDTVAGQ